MTDEKYLSKEQLLSLELSHSRQRAVRAETLNLISLKRALLSKIDPSGQLSLLEAQLSTLKSEQHEVDSFYKATIKDIETSLEINLSEYTYDDKTGKLTYTVADEAPSHIPINGA